MAPKILRKAAAEWKLKQLKAQLDKRGFACFYTSLAVIKKTLVFMEVNLASEFIYSESQQNLRSKESRDGNTLIMSDISSKQTISA